MNQLRIQAQKTVYILMMIFFVSLVFLVSCTESESTQDSQHEIIVDPTISGDTIPEETFSSLTIVARSSGFAPTITQTIEITPDGTLEVIKAEEERLPPDYEVNILETNFVETMSSPELDTLVDLINAASLETQTDIDLSGFQDPYFICDYSTDYDITYVSEAGVENTFSIDTFCLTEHLSDEIYDFIDYVYELVVIYDPIPII